MGSKRETTRVIEGNTIIITHKYSVLAPQSDGALIPKDITTVHTYEYLNIVNNEVTLLHEGKSSDGQRSESTIIIVDLDVLKTNDREMFNWIEEIIKWEHML